MPAAGIPRIDVVGSAAEVTRDRVAGCDVAVIDVFRATSVMITALANGASRIIPVTGIEEARSLRDRLAEGGGRKVLLGGERNTVQIEGFDLDNSPLRYRPEVVEEATIIMSTTNGTRAINCAEGGENIYIAALLNADAVAERLAGSGRAVCLVCSGRQNRFTLEDGLCAGMIARRLVERGYRPTDFAWVMIDLYERWQNDLPGALEHCTHYQRIKEQWKDDIAWCMRSNALPCVPRLGENGGITL